MRRELASPRPARPARTPRAKAPMRNDGSNPFPASSTTTSIVSLSRTARRRTGQPGGEWRAAFSTTLATARANWRSARRRRASRLASTITSQSCATRTRAATSSSTSEIDSCGRHSSVVAVVQQTERMSSAITSRRWHSRIIAACAATRAAGTSDRARRSAASWIPVNGLRRS